MSDLSFNAPQDEVVNTTPDPVNTANTEVAETNSPEEAETPKTFTQDELDKIIAERLAKQERKLRRDLAEKALTPAPTVAPKIENFDTPENYAEALAIHKAEQIIAHRESQKQQIAVQDTYAERADEAKAKYKDFEAVAYSPTLRVTDSMASVIRESEIGPELLYNLGKNPDEASRIAGLSPLRQAQEIGKLEATLSANPAVKKTSSAPEPINPVGTRSTSPTRDTTDPKAASTLSTGDWIKAENDRRAKLARNQ